MKKGPRIAYPRALRYASLLEDTATIRRSRGLSGAGAGGLQEANRPGAPPEVHKVRRVVSDVLSGFSATIVELGLSTDLTITPAPWERPGRIRLLPPFAARTIGMGACAPLRGRQAKLWTLFRPTRGIFLHRFGSGRATMDAAAVTAMNQMRRRPSGRARRKRATAVSLLKSDFQAVAEGGDGQAYLKLRMEVPWAQAIAVLHLLALTEDQPSKPD